MDRSKLFTLIDKIKASGYSYEADVLLSLDEYFDGNDEEFANLCANNRNPPSAYELRDFLIGIRDKACVSDVLIRVVDIEDAMNCRDIWVVSDTVYVITSSDVQEVEEWFKTVLPSDVWEEQRLERFRNLPEIPANSRLVAVWWD